MKNVRKIFVCGKWRRSTFAMLRDFASFRLFSFSEREKISGMGKRKKSSEPVGKRAYDFSYQSFTDNNFALHFSSKNKQLFVSQLAHFLLHTKLTLGNFAVVWVVYMTRVYLVENWIFIQQKGGIENWSNQGTMGENVKREKAPISARRNWINMWGGASI